MIARKPRILFVGSFPQPGGEVIGGGVTDCATLLEAGFAERVDLVTVDSTQRSVPPPPTWKRLLFAVPRAFDYLRKLWSHSPDAVLIFCSSGLSFLEKSLFALVARMFGCRVLLAPRGGALMGSCRSHKLYRQLVRCLLRIPHVLLCQGEIWKAFFVNELNLPANKCTILNNWTATPLLLQIGENRTYDDNGKLRILYLAWLTRTKGIFELIEALDELRDQFPNVQLCIAGEGEESANARKEVTRRGLQDRVEFLGWVVGNRKLESLAAAAVYCLPSYFEGLPNAMIEALATGLPVVVTPVGSIPDVIEDRVNGLICPLKDSHQLAIELAALLSDAALREQLGRQGHRVAARDFGAARAVEELVRLVAKPHGVPVNRAQRTHRTV